MDDDLLLAAGIDLTQFDKDKKGLIQSVLGMNDEFAKGGEGITKAFSIAIAEQKTAIKDIEKELKRVYDQASAMAPGQAQATVLSGANRIEGDLELAKNQLSSLQELKEALGGATASADKLSTKFNEAKNRLAELNREGADINSPEYKAATDDVSEYGKALNDTRLQTKKLLADGLSPIINKLSIFASGMAVAESVQGLFGEQNENTNQIMLKTQALLAVATTLQGINNDIKAEGGVISSVMAVQETARARATALGTSSTIASTVAQRAFNLVANANPYILLATAIITVVGAIALYVAATHEATKAAAEQKELNEKLVDSLAEPLFAYEKLRSEFNALGGDLKKQEQFIRDNKSKWEELGYSVNTTAEAENFFVKSTGAVAQAMTLRAEATVRAQIAMDDYKKGLLAEREYKRIYIDKKLTDGEKLLKVLNDGLGGINGKAEMRRKAEEVREAKQNAIDGLASIDEINKKADAIDQKNNNRRTKVDAKAEKVKKDKKTKTEKADEYLPPGSVAEIQKRLSEIDEALSKSTDGKNIEKLKEKKLSAMVELAEAIKKIETKSLQERASDQEKYNTAYGVILERSGKEVADKMYAPLMDGAQTYYGWLDKEREKLLEKQDAEILTDQDKEDLVFLTQKIDDLEGKKNPLQKFTEGIDAALSKIPTLTGQIDFLRKKAEDQLNNRGNASFSDGEQKLLKEREDALLIQKQQTYNALLKEQETFEEKSLALQREYDEIKRSEQYINSSPVEQKKIDKSFSDKQSGIELDIFKQSADWQVAFGDMEFISQSALRRIEESLLNFKKVKGETLGVEEMTQLENAIKKVQDAQNSNPLTAIIGGLKGLKNAKDEVYFATERYNAAVNVSGQNSEEAKKASKDLAEADLKQAAAKKKLFAAMQEGQNIFNAIGDGVKQLGDAFGGFDDATNDAIGDIMAIGNAAFDFAKSIASGDIAGMITAGIKLIGSIAAAINGDKKKERAIKKQAAALKILELAFNDLSFAADRAFGSMKYSAQTDLVGSLQQQAAAINGMMLKEKSKKKADQEKVGGYQSQLQSIQQQIQQIREGIIKDVLQTDVVDSAAKVGDALVEAFGRGEDAVESLKKAADDMIRNLLRNQLNLALQNKMKPIIDALLSSTGFNADGSGSFTGLSPEQIAAFKAQVVAAGQSMNEFLEGYSEIFGGLGDNEQGLKGDIKGITEKTAGALEGQINAMRINQVVGLEVSRSSLIQLSQIEINTRNLVQIRTDISEMNGKMKKGVAGIP